MTQDNRSKAASLSLTTINRLDDAWQIVGRDLYQRARLRDF